MPPSNLSRSPARPDNLRWAIFLALLGTSQVQAQFPLQAQAGPGGTPIIDHGHGVPVINIAAPNANGLSHNQFLDYNVDRQGLVLNNALQAGSSQLAGQLAANPQFQGQAASTILNEVVSRNASRIEGPQEIFGQKADYLLANPNGITLNGGSFINTANATFLVGTPGIEDGKLQRLDTLSAHGDLQVLSVGQANAEGALRLIAPRLHSEGYLKAKERLDIVVGRNVIDQHNGRILEHRPGLPATIDANLLGAMHAGRICIRSTAEGAGVRMGPTWVSADKGMSIESAGRLDIVGEHDRPVVFKSEQGTLRFKAADDLHLRAVDGHARQISVQAGKNLFVDAAVKQQRMHDRTETDRYNATERQSTADQFEITTLRSSDDTTLRSGQDMTLTAARLTAGDALRLESGADLTITAGIKNEWGHETQSEYDEIWRDNQRSSYQRQSAVESRLVANDLQIATAGTFTARASQLKSYGHLQVDAEKATIEHQGLMEKTQHWTRDKHIDNAPNQQQQWNAASSHVTARTLGVKAGQITLKGSHLHSDDDTLLESSQGPLLVEAARTREESTHSETSKRLLGVLGSTQKSHATKQLAQHSSIHAGGDLRLSSADELRIHGSELKSGRHLSLKSEGNLFLDSTESFRDSVSNSSSKEFTAGVRETLKAQDGKPGSRQWEAFAGLVSPEKTVTTRERTSNTSVIEGGSVSLNSKGLLQTDGAKLQARTGNLDLEGSQVSLGAAQHFSNESTHVHERGVELAYTAGVDRIGHSYGLTDETEISSRQGNRTQGSELLAKGDVTIKSASLITEASRINADGNLKITSGHIDNRAMTDTEVQQSANDSWRIGAGVSVEYAGLTKPFLEIADGKPADRFQQDALPDALSPPSFGADLTVRLNERREPRLIGTARISELSGASIDVKADVIDDQGTAWTASAGKLKIDARQHHMQAAQSRNVHTVENLAGDGDIRIDTTTGEDIGVRGAAKGGYLEKVTTLTRAVVGLLRGQQGVDIRLQGDGQYEGTRIDGGEGSVLLRTDGSLSLTQATDSNHLLAGSRDAKARLKFGNKPGEKNAEFRGYFDQTNRDETQTSARVAQIDGKGEILLSSLGDQSHVGTRIGSEGTETGEINLHSGGALKVSSASNTHKATGKRLDAGAELGGKKGDTHGLGIGGHLGGGKVDENDRWAVDAKFQTTASMTLASQASGALALDLEGLQASANHLSLQALRGGIRIQSSSNQEQRDTWDATAGLGGLDHKGKTETSGAFARVKVEVDQRQNQTWNANTLKAQSLELESGGDAHLQGARLEANLITGRIKGDLHVQSRQDNVDTWIVGTDIRASHQNNPQGWANAVGAFTGPWGKEAKERLKELTKHQPDNYLKPQIHVLREKRDTVAHQAALDGRDGIDLKVAGGVHLVGAKLTAANGSIRHGASSVTTQSLSGNDYRAAASVDLSTSVLDLIPAYVKGNSEKGAADGENWVNILGLVKGSGHDRQEQWAASID